MARSWANAVKAVGILSAASLVLLGSSLAVGLPKWSIMDRNQFAFLPGTWFASQLATVQYPSRTCLLIGVSVVREGFDSLTLKTEVPGVEFVNLATTGGWSPMDVIDIQSSMLIKSPQRYKCIILGMNNFYMRDFTADSYELITSNYISRLPVISLVSMVRLSQGVSQFKATVSKSIMPFGRYSTDAQRWWRYGIYLAKQYFVPETNIANYELFAGEMKPAVQFMYDAMTPQFEKTRKQTADAIVKFDLENPSSFEQPGPALAFNKSMDRLRRLADEVIVVRMPLTTVYRPMEAVAEPSFFRALKSAGIGWFLDCKIGRDAEETYYFDTAHLNPVGRELLSRSVGKVIGRLLDGSSPSGETQNTCSVAEPW